MNFFLRDKTRQLKTVTWPSTTPTTNNKAGSAREGLISPSIVRSAELELAGRLMLYSKDVWTSVLQRNLKKASHASVEETLNTRARLV